MDMGPPSDHKIHNISGLVKYWMRNLPLALLPPEFDVIALNGKLLNS